VKEKTVIAVRAKPMVAGILTPMRFSLQRID
jgi:hypothetical protein